MTICRPRCSRRFSPFLARAFTALTALAALTFLGTLACRGQERVVPASTAVRANDTAPKTTARKKAAPHAGDSLSMATTVTDSNLPPAPPWAAPIRYEKGRGSVTLHLPMVPNARDFRAFVLTKDVRVQHDDAGNETVHGATIHCAGLRQHNQCDDSESMDFGPSFKTPRCSKDPRAVRVSRETVQRIQVDGLEGKSKIVVEAIDALCPFPGAFGSKHLDLPCINEGTTVATATFQGRTVRWPTCPRTFPVRTEQEIRKEYGSLIINGQGPPPPPPIGESPYAKIGLPAPPIASRVLRRSVIEVDPLKASALPKDFTDADFFESFSDESDRPRRVTGVPLVPVNYNVVNPELYETSKLSLYTYGATGAQFFLSEGTLRNTMADASGQIMASSILYPKRAFQFPKSKDRYIHITFETQANATQRRYWWLHACGAAEAGKTVVHGRLAPRSGIVPLPGFMDPLSGLHISTRGWNCIQLVPRGGGYEGIAGGPYKRGDGEPGRPETDIRVVLNPQVTGSFDPANNSDLVLNVSPMQYPYGDASLEGAWMRQWDDQQRPIGVLLDDTMFVEQRTRFDVYLNRGRVVLFADGVQKLCNGFPDHELTMAEAAIGVGSVLYHSSAERSEFSRSDWLRTAQYQYRYNLPFLDQRSYDNVGVRENAALPGNFIEGQCYAAHD